MSRSRPRDPATALQDSASRQSRLARATRSSLRSSASRIPPPPRSKPRSRRPSPSSFADLSQCFLSRSRTCSCSAPCAASTFLIRSQPGAVSRVCRPLPRSAHDGCAPPSERCRPRISSAGTRPAAGESSCSCTLTRSRSRARSRSPRPLQCGPRQRIEQFRAGSAGAGRSRDELSDKVAEDFNSPCLRFFDPSAAAPTALDLGGAVARRLLVRSLSFCATCPASDCKVIT